MYKISFSSKILLLFVAITIINTSVYSQNGTEQLDTPGKVADADKNLKEFCQQAPGIQPKIFPETFEKVLSLRKDFCSGELSAEELQNRMVNVYLDLNIIFPVSRVFGKIWKTEKQRLANGQSLSQFFVEDEPLRIEYDDQNQAIVIDEDLFNECNKSVKSIDSSSSCYSALVEFRNLYNFAHSTLSQPLAWDLFYHLENLEKQWDQYYERSKAQTIWELVLNGYFFQRENKEHEFMLPPNYQFILLHPGLVVENIPKALDGEHVENAITLEAFGINYWKQDTWYLPSGAALLGLYADRIGDKDWGYGLAVYFNNNYTFGISRHDNVYGYFASVDFLKFIQDKQSTLENIRGKIDF